MKLWLVSGYGEPKAYLSKTEAKKFLDSIYNDFLIDSSLSVTKTEDSFKYTDMLGDNHEVTIQQVTLEPTFGWEFGIYDSDAEIVEVFESQKAAKEGLANYLVRRWIKQYGPEDTNFSLNEIRDKVNEGIEDGYMKDLYCPDEYVKLIGVQFS